MNLKKYYPNTSIKNIELDNIHIRDMEITTLYSGGTACIGAIVGNLSSGSSSLADKINIQNCSVQGLTVDFGNNNITSVRVGGLVGSLYVFGGGEAKVTNSFAYNVVVNAANITSVRGIGGIVGYKGHDTDERAKPGTPYVYIENCYSTGKINAMNYTGRNTWIWFIWKYLCKILL